MRGTTTGRPGSLGSTTQPRPTCDGSTPGDRGDSARARARAVAATPRVDLLAGGFPCQHISQAAARTDRAAGWLWPEFRRAIDLLAPRWVVIENVEALRYANRGLAEVLGDLAALGFDAEWRSVRASWFGASHHRARLWVVANSYRNGEPALSVNDEASWLSEPAAVVPDWRVVPDLRVADGVPDRVVRRGRLGNAVIPAVAEWVGRCVMQAEARRLEKAA